MDTLIRLSLALGLGPEPLDVLERLRKVYEVIDLEVEVHAETCSLPCRMGCDACCHEAVFLSAPEFLGVAADLLLRYPLGERREIVEEMQRIGQRYSDELELLLSLPAGEERDEVAARVKFRCPLLLSDGRCGVYGARELNARTFGKTWDLDRSSAYGCALTHERLRVLPPEAGPALFDAREARRRLVLGLPGTDLVHVYPWWFARFGSLLVVPSSSDEPH